MRASSRSIQGRDLAGVSTRSDPQAGYVAPWTGSDHHCGGGAYADYALASVHAVALEPTDMSFAEAAGVPVVGETRLAGDRDRSAMCKLPVRRVLIEGRAGGIELRRQCRSPRREALLCDRNRFTEPQCTAAFPWVPMKSSTTTRARFCRCT